MWDCLSYFNICVPSCSFLGHNFLHVLYIHKYKKQLQKIERKVGMEYQKAYKQG